MLVMVVVVLLPSTNIICAYSSKLYSNLGEQPLFASGNTFPPDKYSIRDLGEIYLSDLSIDPHDIIHEIFVTVYRDQRHWAKPSDRRIFHHCGVNLHALIRIDLLPRLWVNKQSDYGIQCETNIRDSLTVINN